MPFKSRSQWKLCFALERQGKSFGKKSCKEWTKGVSYRSLPNKVSDKKSVKKTQRKGSKKKSKRMISKRRSHRSRMNKY